MACMPADTALVTFFKGPGGIIGAAEAMQQMETAAERILGIIGEP